MTPESFIITEFACNKFRKSAFVRVKGHRHRSRKGGKKMASNVGAADRTVRFVLGIVLIGLGLTLVLSGGLAIAAYCVGGIALLTGAIGYCPAWSVFWH